MRAVSTCPYNCQVKDKKQKEQQCLKSRDYGQEGDVRQKRREIQTVNIDGKKNNGQYGLPG
jgi:hypothetical protein